MNNERSREFYITRLRMDMTQADLGGNQSPNISRSTVVKRLRLCSCHETLKSLLKNRKWGAFYNNIPDNVLAKVKELLTPKLWAVTKDFCTKYR